MNVLRELDLRRATARRAGPTSGAWALVGPAAPGAPGDPADAARARVADTARQVYELWHTAGVLPDGAEAPRGRAEPVGSSARAVEGGEVRHG